MGKLFGGTVKQEQTYQGTPLTDKTHPTHEWAAADDILECARCGVRIYNAEAKQPCTERRHA